MAINITSDTVVKLIVRNGDEADRKNVLFSVGELGYAKNTKRLFVGDGTVGGHAVGNITFDPVDSRTVTLSGIVQPGDTVFDKSDGNLYQYTLSSSWYQISPKFDNYTIIRTNETWGVNPTLLATTISALDLSVLRNLSASWNFAVSTVSARPANSVLANYSSNTGAVSSLVIGNNQIVGKTSTGTLTALTLSAVSGLNVTTTANTFTIDGSQLQNSINTLTTNVSAISANVALIGTTFYRETTFAYQVNTWNTYQSRNGIVNQWQFIFADNNKAPLTLAVGPYSTDQQVRVEGRIHSRLYDNANSIWYRLGLFSNSLSSLSATTASTPVTALSTLDVNSYDGLGSYVIGFNPTFSTVYNLPAGQVATFGLQAYIYVARGGNGGSTTSSVGFNTWQVGGTYPSSLYPWTNIGVGSVWNTTLLACSATQDTIKANANIFGSTTLPSNDNAIRNICYLRATLI